MAFPYADFGEDNFVGGPNHTTDHNAIEAALNDLKVYLQSTLKIYAAALTANIDGAGYKLSDIKLEHVEESINEVAATGATEDIDWAYPINDFVLNQDCVFSDTNLPVTAGSTVLYLDLSASAYTPTFPGAWDWGDNGAPTWADARYWQLVGITRDGGTQVEATAGWRKS